MILLAGPKSKDKEPIQDVIWEEVEDALRTLDRQTQTSVFFREPHTETPAAMPYMAASGGNDKYIAYVIFDDSQF